MCVILHILFTITYDQRLRWSRGSVLAFSTRLRGFKPGRSRRIFKGEKILSTPSFGGEVNPSFSAKLPDNILAHSSHFRRWDLSPGGEKWEHLKSGVKQW